jgi:hypothetical protein
LFHVFSAQKVHLKSSPPQDRITGLLQELAHTLRVDAHEAAAPRTTGWKQLSTLWRLR